MRDSTITIIITTMIGIITLIKTLIEGVTKETQFIFGAFTFFLIISATMLYLETKIEKQRTEIIVPKMIFKEKKK